MYWVFSMVLVSKYSCFSQILTISWLFTTPWKNWFFEKKYIKKNLKQLCNIPVKFLLDMLQWLWFCEQLCKKSNFCSLLYTPTSMPYLSYIFLTSCLYFYHSWWQQRLNKSIFQVYLKDFSDSWWEKFANS